ncbi:MAG TPA: tetratricopeptide repeat protein [Pyrinomonadaceae bacterium]|nr:tetratricopeptide repeat protein [Pyrinomonadaceae bacterium]
MTNPASYEYDIFLSHNYVDEVWTTKLAERLEREDWQGRKLKVFFSPWDIRPGQSIPKRIEEALPKSRKVGLIMSPEAMASAWVEVERLVTTYIDVTERQERLIPLYRRACEIPALLRPILYIDFRDDDKFEESYKKLLAIIKDEPLPRGSNPLSDGSIVLPASIPRPPVVGFVPRQDENGQNIIKQLTEQLAPQKNQLVALWGSGGVGKTTLAAEAVRNLAGIYNQRIIWVSADTRANLPFTTFLDEIAEQLGRADLRPLAPELKEQEISALIAHSPTLLVLDNFETIAAKEQSLCLNFLAQRARCPVLITTRERIAEARLIPLATMSQEEASDLLERLISQTHDSSIYAEVDRNRILSEAEFNPLVIQWIVAQIDLAQDPEEVLSELAQGEGDAAYRVFDRSFNLPQMAQGGRAVLLALPLFTPSAMRPALAEVAGMGKDKDKKKFKKAQQTLASLWLVKQTRGGQRLAIDGLTRELAGARLSRDLRSKIFRERFVVRFLRYAVSNSHPTAEHLNALEAEKDNILNAIDVAFEINDGNSLIRIHVAMDEFLRLRGYWDESIRRGEQALEVARKLSDEYWIKTLTHNLALAYQPRGNLSKARELYDESLYIERKFHNQSGIAMTLLTLGTLAQDQGELEEARRLYDESMEISKKLADQRGIANTLHELGRLAQAQGELEEARRLYDESMEIDKKLDNQSGISISLRALGTLAQEQEELEEARQLYNESMEISKKLGNQSGIAGALHQLGRLAQDQGELDEARRLYDESLEIAKKLGDQSAIASTLGQLGLLAAQESDRAEATRLLREALSIFERLKSPYAEIARESLRQLEDESS